ncbi:MAG: hypothetical protein CO137_01460, partial [Candidatus Magasanikbacteria bacterium CG_4_9_14_3_um_filter_32_9]
SIYTIVPLVTQRFDVSTKIGVAQTTLSSFGMLVVVLLGYKLEAIFLSQLLISIIFTLVYRNYSQKILPIAKLKFQWHKKEIIKCYKFGLVAYISNISGQTLSYFDKLIIPIFINPASLSYYSLSGSVASKSTGLISSLTNILFPLTSSLNGGGDKEKIGKLYIRSFRLTSILSASIAFSICFFSYKIMQYWLSEDIALNTYKILIILALTYFIISIYNPLSSFLLGLGKTKILAFFSVLMAMVNIVFLFILLPKFGIMGAAIAYLISMLPTVYMVFYTERTILNLNNRFSFYVIFYLKLFFTGAIFYVFSKIFIYPFIVSLSTLLVLGPFSVLVYLLLYKIFGFFEEDDLVLFKNFGFMFFCRVKRIIR